MAGKDDDFVNIENTDDEKIIAECENEEIKGLTNQSNRMVSHNILSDNWDNPNDPQHRRLSTCFTSQPPNTSCGSKDSQGYQLSRFAKKPPTTFITSQDWSLYVRVCCHLRQIKAQYGCSDAEAHKWLPTGSASRRKGSCIIRLVAAFNRLYCEYANLCDANLSLSSVASGMRSSAKKSSRGIHSNFTLAGLSSKQYKLIRSCSKCSVSNPHSDEKMRICPRHAYLVSNGMVYHDAPNTSATGPNGLCRRRSTSPEVPSEKTLTDGPQSGSTPLNTDTASIHLNSQHSSMCSRSMSQCTQTSPNHLPFSITDQLCNGYSSQHQRLIHNTPSHGQHPVPGACTATREEKQCGRFSCFRWCSRSASLTHKSSDEAGHARLTAHGDTGSPGGGDGWLEAYDQIRRNPLRSSITIFRRAQHERCVEHQAQVPPAWLRQPRSQLIAVATTGVAMAPDGLERAPVAFCEPGTPADLRYIRLPIALELLLPRMQRQIEAVMAACRFIYDPLEVAAELRRVNYDTDTCIAYFEQTRVLRDVIQEFLPRRGGAADVSGGARQTQCSRRLDACGHVQMSTGDAQAAEAAGSGDLGSGKAVGGLPQLLRLVGQSATADQANEMLVQLTRQVAALQKSARDADRRLQRLRTFVKNCSSGLRRLCENLMMTATTAAVAAAASATNEAGDGTSGKEPASAVSASGSINGTDSLCGQVGRLTRENSSLKTMLRLEEHRRKTVFNMMQEYLGNIRVYCRCRGIANTPICLEVRSMDTVCLNLAGMNSGGGSGTTNTEDFKFDRVFDVQASQTDVYAELAPLICSFLDGYNVCFLTYGGEASGKTFTLLGGQEGCPDQYGIAQRALHTVLTERELRKDDWDYRLAVATIEVYNDTFVDLLSGETGLHLRVDLGLERMMEFVRTVPIQTPADVDDLLRVCRARRRIGKTALNPASSRSHLVLLLRLQSHSRLHDNELCSVLALCDLAGFEDIIKAETMGDPTLAKEAGYINRSLTALNRVFVSLRSQDPATVSYRDTKLTYLLKPFFTNSGKCILIVTVRTDRASLASTQGTLRFGRESRGVSLGRARRQISLDRLIDDVRLN